MPAHQWQYRIDELPSPPMATKRRQNDIANAITELQDNVLTWVRCDDGTVGIEIKGGVAIIKKADAPGEGERVQIACVQDVVWDDPALKYTPVTIDMPADLVTVTVGETVTVDTTEACP